jgi:hypothetical protein
MVGAFGSCNGRLGSTAAATATESFDAGCSAISASSTLLTAQGFTTLIVSLQPIAFPVTSCHRS